MYTWVVRDSESLLLGVLVWLEEKPPNLGLSALWPRDLTGYLKAPGPSNPDRALEVKAFGS